MELVTGGLEMGDLRVAFDRRLKLEFHGSRVTSDAGLLAFRELDDALGLTEIAGQVLADLRTGKNNRHTLTAGRARAKPVAGEVRPHCRKTSENRPSGVWHGGQADDSATTDVVATLFHLPRGPGLGYSAVNQGRMASYLGNVGCITMTVLLLLALMGIRIENASTEANHR